MDIVSFSNPNVVFNKFGFNPLTLQAKVFQVLLSGMEPVLPLNI
jgi:hypothetical protein